MLIYGNLKPFEGEPIVFIQVLDCSFMRRVAILVESSDLESM